MRRTEAWRRERGQHFLSGAPSVVRRMVEAATVAPGDHVLDVGAGTGAFTELLGPAVGPTGRVTAIEADAGLASRLEGKGIANTVVVAGDALAVPLPQRIDAVVANPPYRILVPLLMRLFRHGFGRAVVVVPRELAERLTAEAGGESYGKLTVQAAARGTTETLFRVAKHAFDPPPEVASCVIRVVPHAAGSPQSRVDLALLDTVLEAAWMQRNRTNRHAFAPLAALLGIPPMAVTLALRDAGMEGKTPVATSPADFFAVVQELAKSRAPAARAGSPS